MKFRRLTREERKHFHEEFAVFLASYGIDKELWDEIKNNETERAEGVLDLFSDFIFEQTLPKVTYLEQISPSKLAVYSIKDKTIHGIFIVAKTRELDLSEIEWETISEKVAQGFLEIYEGSRKMIGTHETEVFNLMQQGALPANDELFKKLKALVGK